MDEMKDNISGGYRSVADSIDSATDALQNRSKLASHALAVTAGIGMGVGLGLLLAPGRGEKTRGTVKKKASDLQGAVVEATRSAASELPHLPPRIRAS